MEKNKLWAYTASVVAVLFIVLYVVAQTTMFTKVDVDEAIMTAEQEKDEAFAIVEDLLNEKIVALEAQVTDLAGQIAEVDALLAELEGLPEEKAYLEAKLAELEAELAQTENQIIVLNEIKKEFDDLLLNGVYSFSLAKRDLETLTDYKIKFDKNDIKVKENLYLNVEFASNDRKFEGKPLMKLEQDSVVYLVEFGTDMTALDYTKDKVRFNFLGEEFVVVDWTVDSITLDSVASLFLKEGETKNGVTIVRIGETSVLISYNDETKIVKEGDTAKFGDSEVEVEAIFYEAGGNGLVSLKVADELVVIIEDGDEYEPNDFYDWSVTSNSVGIRLVELLDVYDTAIPAKQVFVLPNEYLGVSFYLDVVETQDVRIEYISATEVRFRGSFEDAEGRVHFDGTEFVDREGTSFGTEIFFENSDYSIIYNGVSFEIGGLEVSYLIDDLIVNGVSYTTSDENVLSDEGILVKSPKKDLEKNELNIVVPEEQVFITLRVA